MQIVAPRPAQTGLMNPLELPGTEAWYDIQDPSSMVIDGSNRVSLVADKSGNSAENCLILPGVTGNYASTPDAAALDIAGDIDISLRVALTDWSPSAVNTLVGKYTGLSDQRGYLFDVNTTGTFRFIWSTDGTSGTIQTAESTASSGITDLFEKWVRVTLDVDNGAGGYDVKFYLSDDGSDWTQLGDTIVGGSTTSIFNSSQTLQIGSQASGAANMASGRFYRAIVKDGIDGTTVFDADFTAQSKLATSFTESSSNAALVTVIPTAIALPARIHGARDRYQGVAANKPIYLSAVNQSDDLNTNTAVNGSSPFDTFTGESETGVTFADSSANARRLSWQLSKTLVIGRKYRVTFDYTKNSGSAQTSLQLRASADGAVGQVITSNLGSTGQRNITFTATVTDRYLTVNKAANGDNSVDAEISNLSFVELESPSAYLYYDGSNDDMRTPPWPLEQPESVYFAGSQVTWTDLDYIYDGGNITDMAFRQQNASGRIYLQAGSLGPYITAGIGENFVAASVFNGASSSNRLNLETAVTGNAGTNAADAFIIGGRGSPFGNYANITETGVIIRSTADDAATQARFIRYLAQKGGISV